MDREALAGQGDMPDDFDYADDDLEDDDDLVEDCHMGPDGQCDMAGSEWCDWDCPLAEMHARARIAKMKARQKP